jgi:hypothetical protein
VTGSRSGRRPTGFGMLLLTGMCLILPASAMLVTAVDRQARDATLLGGATPIVLGVAMLIVLVGAVAALAGRGGSVAVAGLILAAVVFAVTGVGLLMHGPATLTAGVILLPAAIATLALARIIATTPEWKATR